MMIEHSLEIAAPVEVVWALTHDIEAWPRHTPTITSVERLDPGPLAVGSRARVRQPRLPDRTWTVSHLEPNQRLTWSTRLAGVEMIATHRVERVEPGASEDSSDRARNTLVVEIEGALAPIVGALLRGPMLRAIATENEGFRSAAEARAGVTPAG